MPEGSRSDPDEYLLQRVRAEFLEMPGLCLTRPQARRLWGLDDETCADVLKTLVERKFLSRGSDGGYHRLTEGRLPASAQRTAKADVRPHDEPTRVRSHPTMRRAV